MATNILANHPSYPKIISVYNGLLKEKGKVNNLEFYRSVILPEIPGYNQQSWYKFLRRFKTEAGVAPITPISPQAPMIVGEEGAELAQTLKSNSEATSQAIALALNISLETLEKIRVDPTLLSEKERAELFLKVMKAQDSRVKAIGNIRADTREQERFEASQSSAAFG